MMPRLPHFRRGWVAALMAVAINAACASIPAPHPGKQDASAVGFLVLAPDRGFLGNEELHEAFAELARERNAALVFVTDDRTRLSLEAALLGLRERGAQRIVSVPLFITESHPKWTLAKQLLDELTSPGVEMALRFGASYLAVEILSDHFRRIASPSGRRVIIVEEGASDEPSRERMTAELSSLGRAAGAGFGFADVRALVWRELSGPRREELAEINRNALRDAVAGSERPLVVPFHLGKKFDSMMTLNASLRRELPEGAELLDVDVTPHRAVALWMQREVNRATLSARDIGVVVLAHGADYHWNESMRTALGSFAERYATEFAFCMADQPLVERAVRRLEARGVRGIVIVRVFGMASSFRGTVERMAGMDIEYTSSHRGDHGLHEGHGHAHGAAAAVPSPRIRSAAVITTLGGLEDHALFAEALVSRARELSREPARETVILVAHGAVNDGENDHWLRVLESLGRQMRANGAGDFRSMHVATWREDWPEKREPWVAKVREQIRMASESGGRALVIPARTNSHGPERELLQGLDFRLGEGFAPHPLFARWVEDQIRQGQTRLLGRDAGSERWR